VENFALLARPWTDLLKKGTLFVWTLAHESAFEALKTALVTASILALPDFNKAFQLQADALDRGLAQSYLGWSSDCLR
jgi:hypothetical protein